MRHVLAVESDRLRELRLTSLQSDPDAFASTYAREVAHPAGRWAGWAQQSEHGGAERTFVLVGEDDQWLGLALVRLDDAQPTCAVLNAMWIAPEARGRRGACLLCDACATWAIDRGVEQLTLQVAIDNQAAHRAYEAAGFVVCGQSTWTDDDRTLEEFDMVRSLVANSQDR